MKTAYPIDSYEEKDKEGNIYTVNIYHGGCAYCRWPLDGLRLQVKIYNQYYWFCSLECIKEVKEKIKKQ